MHWCTFGDADWFNFDTGIVIGLTVNMFSISPGRLLRGFLEKDQNNYVICTCKGDLCINITNIIQ